MKRLLFILLMVLAAVPVVMAEDQPPPMGFPKNPDFETVRIGGAYAAIAIEDKYHFDDDTARTDYFTTNPTELIDGRLVVVMGVGEIQKYNLATTTWISISTALRGPQGPAGGTITDRVEVDGTSALSDSDVMQTLVTNYLMAAGGDTTLPAYSGGAKFTVLTESPGQDWSLKPPEGEAFVLDGTALDADDEIDIGQVVGDSADLWRVRTGEASYQWYFFTNSGTHTDGGES